MIYVNAWLLRLLSIAAGGALAFLPAAYAREVFLTWYETGQEQDPLPAAFFALAFAVLLQCGAAIWGWFEAYDMEKRHRRNQVRPR